MKDIRIKVRFSKKELVYLLDCLNQSSEIQKKCDAVRYCYMLHLKVKIEKALKDLTKALENQYYISEEFSLIEEKED